MAVKNGPENLKVHPFLAQRLSAFVSGLRAKENTSTGLCS